MPIIDRIRRADELKRKKRWRITDRLRRAADRGSADRYYGRMPRPHLWLDGVGHCEVVGDEMSSEEVLSYLEAYDAEEYRKDWDD